MKRDQSGSPCLACTKLDAFDANGAKSLDVKRPLHGQWIDQSSKGLINQIDGLSANRSGSCRKMEIHLPFKITWEKKSRDQIPEVYRTLKADRHPTDVSLTFLSGF